MYTKKLLDWTSASDQAVEFARDIFELREYIKLLKEQLKEKQRHLARWLLLYPDDTHLDLGNYICYPVIRNPLFPRTWFQKTASRRRRHYGPDRRLFELSDALFGDTTVAFRRIEEREVKDEDQR